MDVYLVMLFMMLDAWSWWMPAILVSQLIPLFLGVYLFWKKKEKISKNQINVLSLICFLWYVYPIFSQILYYLIKYVSEFVLCNQWKTSLLEFLSEFDIPSFMFMPIVLIITIIIACIFLVKFLQKKHKLKKDKKNWMQIEEERVKIIENLKIFTINLFASPLFIALVIIVEILLIPLMKSIK